MLRVNRWPGSTRDPWPVLKGDFWPEPTRPVFFWRPSWPDPTRLVVPSTRLTREIFLVTRLTRVNFFAWPVRPVINFCQYFSWNLHFFLQEHQFHVIKSIFWVVFLKIYKKNSNFFKKSSTRLTREIFFLDPPDPSNIFPWPVWPVENFWLTRDPTRPVEISKFADPTRPSPWKICLTRPDPWPGRPAASLLRRFQSKQKSNSWWLCVWPSWST